MNRTVTAGMQPGAISGGMLWLLGAAFALTQLTSLALGPAVNRQLHLSLSVPAVEVDDASGSFTGTDAVVGSIAAPAPAPAPATTITVRVVASRQLSSAAASIPAVAPVTIVVGNQAPVTSASAASKARRGGHDDKGLGRRAGKVPAQD